ncbi:MAG: hypothetical protein EBZ48_04790 [Proteobacteria bacterium]|nr:hypothetical protein [Pseudomonadota bacterium]
MVVKDVQATGVAPDPQAVDSKPLSSEGPIEPPSDETALSMVANTDDRAGKVRDGANELIHSINLAAEATDAIGSMVKSIYGIVQQVSSDALPANRVSKLEEEANSLVDAIKTKVASAAHQHTNPLLGDPIRLEVEDEIGRTLDLVLPDHAKENFGLGAIDFSRKELIMSVRGAIERAQRQVEELKQAVGDSRKTVEATLNEVDVALQNAEAAQVSVRDLDAALQLVGRTSSVIRSNPASALSAYRGFRDGALELLE